MSGSKAETPTDVPTVVGVQKTEHNYRKYIATRQIPTCREAKSALSTMCYADAHVAIMELTGTELSRGPWSTRAMLRVLTVRPVQ